MEYRGENQRMFVEVEFLPYHNECNGSSDFCGLELKI